MRCTRSVSYTHLDVYKRQVVGPEGGLEISEVNALTELGYVRCSLGKRILRSETAPLYMLSVIGFYRELKEEL